MDIQIPEAVNISLGPGIVEIKGPKGNIAVPFHQDLKVTQTNGNVLVGGFFTKHNDYAVSRVAMLGSKGNLLKSFNPGQGPDNPVYSVSFQTDGKILVGGSFYSFDNMIRPGIVRLNLDGTITRD